MYGLRLFGGASIEALDGDSDVPSRARQRHRLAMLALLAVESRGLSRDKLIGFLWPESDAKRGRNLLSVSLYVLRNSLGERVLLSPGDELRLNLESIAVDVVEFERAIERGDHEAAVELYAGSFLDGFFLPEAREFELWADRQRARLDRLYADALEALANDAEASGEARDAVKWWKQRVAHDRFDSRVTVRLMQALEAAGNRAGALELADVHAALLREEFGTNPASEVSELAERLRDASSTARRDSETGRRPGADEQRASAPDGDAAAERDVPAPGHSADRPAKRLTAALVLGVIVLSIGVWVVWPETDAPDRSIAVLPFDNLSPDPNDAYLAAGVHEEILTQLARVGGIKLISRTSVLRYRDTEKSLPEIADELGVATILEGSVQRVGGEIRIAVQLADAREDEHLWAERYDRELSDIFQIQTDVATRIVEELRGVLTPDERAELARRPTDDLEAYAHYLRGHELRGRYFASQEGIRAAAEAYGRAVELDSTFAAAWARLVEARSWLAWFRRDFEQRERARSALERLERIAPDSPHLHLARGLWLYRGEERYGEALEEFEVLSDLWPGDVSVMQMRGILYRILGRWDEALRTMEEVFELDPVDASRATNIAWTYMFLRRHAEAERYAKIAVSREPEDPFIWGFLVWARLSRGDTAAARVAVDSARHHLGAEATDSRWAWGWGLYQYFTGGYEELLELYREHPMRYTSFPDIGLAVAAARGRDDLVRLYSDTLRTWAERMLAAAPPEYGEVRSQAYLHLALVEGYRGNAEEAVRLANEGVRLHPVSDNAFGGPDRLIWQAHVYTVVGRHDEAVELLRHLLSIPTHLITVPQLRMDLRWDPLRDHPEFRTLLTDHPTD